MGDLSSLVTKSFLHKAWEKSAFKQLTEIQEKAIPLILERKDVMAESPTGTGKTLAYVIPVLETITNDSKNVEAVILAPSRELVMQINDVIQQWSEGSSMTSATLIGGANIKRQIERLKSHPKVIVGTPGRILELIKAKKLKMHEVKTIVLDEGDQLLISEHQESIELIIRTTMKDRQLVMFSATLPESTLKIGRTLMDNPVSIQSGTTENNVEHLYILADKRDKPEIVRKLVKGQPMTALLFARDIGNLNVLSQRLNYKGVEHRVLHSEATKQERVDAIQNFRKGMHSLLLATDIAARGLDIHNVSHVIHYDVSKDSIQYTHRSGRTGRMGASGTVISIVTKSEEKKLKKIAHHLNISVKEKILYKGKLTNQQQKNVNKRKPHKKTKHSRNAKK